MPASAGHHARLSYLWEDDSNGNPDFATDSPDDSDNKPFGHDASLDTREGSNNAVRVFQPASREASDVIEQHFSGSWSVSFTMTNPWWLRAVVDHDVSSSGSSAPFTHTYDGDVPYSMRLVQGTESTGNHQILKGCVIASAELSAEVEGMVTVSLDGAYADEEDVDTDVGASQPDLNERPMHFGHATVSRGGSTLSLVQSASLTIENNTDIIRELGNRVGVDYSPKARTADVTYTDIVEDNDEVRRMYGDAASPQVSVTNTADIVFAFDNGLSGSALNSMQINLDNVFPNSYSRSGVGDPEADLEGELSEMAPTLDASAENSTDPAR